MNAGSFDMANFFQINKTKFPHVFTAARLVLLTPATSGPVERVFSQGSILMRPHRSSISSDLLVTLMLLKCNVGAFE
jgi:hypothetical protein